ncbi:MAG: tetratricopeptide repeat protein [Bacteroidota bacterium]|nr:tetratricopeptide repeat protein [Bacteroidota bacterium]
MNKLKIFIALILIAIMLIMAGAASAQQTAVHTDPDKDYKLALELYNKEKFAAARSLFEKAVSSNKDAHSEIKINCDFYSAMCAVELFHNDAEDKLNTFIENHPESPKVGIAIFKLGNYHYRKKKYKNAIEQYELVDIYELTTDELAEFYFKAGYSYYETEQYDQASKMFFEIKDVDTRYTNPANYYYSHISYTTKNYETALVGFQKLQNEPVFGPIVPYYISQIYFLQKRYEMVVQYAPPLLETEDVKRAPEVARLIGESYFKLNEFEKSIPFLEQFRKSTGRLSREDAYQLGFAYLKTKNYEKAVELFQQVTRVDDELAQNAFYQIGKAYLEQGNKNFARNSFRQASKLEFDKTIKEDALFTYAKLSYELANNPYNEAIEAFNSYIKAYPGTDRADEAYKYLLNVFFTTRNYKEALVTIESINKKTKDLEYAYQKMAYYRGIDLFNTANFSAAVVHFDKALTYQLDKNINAQSYYWKAEAQYHQRKYDQAITSYQTFLFEPGAAALPEYFAANYNLGYAYFKQKNYPAAISWFRKYTGVTPVDDNKKLNDALLRIADSYFITKNYDDAVEYYGKAANLQGLNTDYALYQKAICIGLTGKLEAKLPVLESVVQNYPASFYAIDSKFEMGKTYLALGDNTNALKYFQKIITEHPNSSVVSKAMVKQGLIYFNQNEDEKAVAIYKKVINDYPGTPESHQALANYKNVAVAQGKAEEYSNFVEKLPFANVTRTSLDSTFFESAEGLYLKGDCQDAINKFENYLQKFPEGVFLLQVNFYKSECHYSAKQYEKALSGYVFVLGQPRNIFTEKSLSKTAFIFYNQKNYEKARSTYEQLEIASEHPALLKEARLGLMRTNYSLNNLQTAKEYANKTLVMENISQPVINEANLIQAKAELEENKLDIAFEKFKLVSVNARTNEIGAESKYNMAYIKYLQKKHKESEKEIFELAEKFSAYDYWVAKSFILLSDNYLAINDAFQAKHTLQSIIDNYEGEDLKGIAKEKLNTILEAEKLEKQNYSPEPIEIQMNEDKRINERLFNEKNVEEEKNND